MVYRLIAIVLLMSLGGWLAFTAVQAGLRQDQHDQRAFQAATAAGAPAVAPTTAPAAKPTPKTSATAQPSAAATKPPATTKPPAAAPPPADDLPKPGKVTVHMVTLTYPDRNIRSQPTTVGNQPVRQAHAGDRLATVALLTGQDPYGDGRNLWLRLAEAGGAYYMWADSTDAVSVYAQTTPSAGAPPVAAPAAAAAPAKPAPPVAAPAPVATKATATVTAVLPLDHYWISGRFGETGGSWGTRHHTGVDMAAPSGTPIHAATAGVVKLNFEPKGAGIYIVEYLPNGTQLLYEHMSRTAVPNGAKVAVGQVIGYVGATGHATGPHLHFEYRPRGGPAVDPVRWFQSVGLQFPSSA